MAVTRRNLGSLFVRSGCVCRDTSLNKLNCGLAAGCRTPVATSGHSHGPSVVARYGKDGNRSTRRLLCNMRQTDRPRGLPHHLPILHHTEARSFRKLWLNTVRLPTGLPFVIAWLKSHFFCFFLLIGHAWPSELCRHRGLRRSDYFALTPASKPM